MSLSLPFLQTLGLSTTEISLYELLLRLGEVPASTIIAESRLKRPTVYKALYSLEKKKLVEQKDINKKIHFRPLPPAVLSSMADDQFQKLQRAKLDLQAMLPVLASSYIKSVEQPIVNIYEGISGIKAIYEDTLVEGKPIDAVLQTAEVEPEIFEWLNNVYAKKRTRAKIHAKVIVASGKWASDYRHEDLENFRTTILVDHELFPFQHEVNIYGDKVAFINWRKGEKLIGIIIKHPQIATTMKAVFDLAWIGAQKPIS